MEHEEANRSDLLHLGVALINLLAEHTGYVAIELRPSRRDDTRYFVCATPKVVEWIENRVLKPESEPH